MPLDRGHFDTRGQRGRVNDPNLPGATWVSPKGHGKTAKKLFDCEEVLGKRAETDSCIHGQGITIFARDRPQLHIAALKRKSQSINSLPYYSRNEI